MPYNDVYTVRHTAWVSTAITILQIKTGATTPAEIISWEISEAGQTTSAQERIRLVRKSSAATVSTAIAGTQWTKQNVGAPNPDMSFSTTATGYVASAEGTDSEIVEEVGFNVLNGFQRIYIPEERPHIQAASTVGLKFTAAPGSQQWSFAMKVRELG